MKFMIFSPFFCGRYCISATHRKLLYWE